VEPQEDSAPLLEMLDRDDQSAKDEYRHGRDSKVQKYFFPGAGLSLFVAFDLLVKAIEHS
jgi:hypothetical protein